MEDYLHDYTDPYSNDRPRVGPVKRFFFACAGAYMKILDACPSEHTKYVGIGATIFLTACLAVLSGSFALYTLLQSTFAAIFFGLLWGALIFNLDRYIVSSIRKEGRFWHEFGMAVPRLLLAVLISIVITKPLEVKLFHNQIKAEMVPYINQLHKEAVADLDSRLGLDSIRTELQNVDSMRLEFKKLKEGKPNSFDFGEISSEYSIAKRTQDSLFKAYTPRIKANDKRRNYLWATYAKKVYATDAQGQRKFVRWDFPKQYQQQSSQLYVINKQLQKELDEQAKLVQELETKRRDAREEYAQGVDEEITHLNAKREELVLAKAEKEAERKSELPVIEEKIERYEVGFAPEIQVLERMKDEDSSIWWMSNLIVLLFILLETSPVFVKLISKRGPYDYLLSRIEHAKKVESLRYISDMNYDLNSSMRLQARRGAEGLNGYATDPEIYSEN